MQRKIGLRIRHRLQLRERHKNIEIAARRVKSVSGCRRTEYLKALDAAAAANINQSWGGTLALTQRMGIVSSNFIAAFILAILIAAASKRRVQSALALHRLTARWPRWCRIKAHPGSRSFAGTPRGFPTHERWCNAKAHGTTPAQCGDLG
jgi:hypothetical protein